MESSEMTLERSDGTTEDEPVHVLAFILALHLPIDGDGDLPGRRERYCCCLLVLDESLLAGADNHISLHGSLSLRVPGANRTLFLDIRLQHTEASLLSQDLEALFGETIISNDLDLEEIDRNGLVPVAAVGSE